MKYAVHNRQVLFTATDPSLFPDKFVAGAQIWDVKGGTVTPRE